ncbi:DUF4493 domain-containing protein [Phocaeicola barnesiae]|uniref:DUF4493 domain-containing protein n=1 Tax=Phocaeicola barnesiae TaxID=376804 RepID=UPI001F339B0E|nr:DUF4493 domain-containing protein [Phocaeicola barnesiae]MCF2597933.1 DUF4493 domain-containing protein [Phocaeicola barnesiae]
MHKQILYILSLMGLFSFAACTNEESPLLSDGMGEIRFSVVDTTEVEITTRASYYFDVNKFNVSLNRGSEPIFSNKKYGDLAGKTFTYSASPDYVLTAESCTEAEAESANQGWGQARISGKESFAIVKDESKTVTVNCGVVNSSVSVKFSDYITSMFTTYSIELHATDATSRTFTFDKSNYTFKTAYFNVGESGRKVAYTISLPSLENPYTGELTLEPSKSYNLSVKVEGEGEGETVTLELIVDNTLLEKIILTEKINPYQ